MKARMQPLDNLFARFPRMVRDLAHKMGKEIEFSVEGRETELDRSVIEVIGDPLIHLLRNCVDHGIEMPDTRIAAGKSGSGHVSIRARHQENQIVIEIEDDGRGIDTARIRARAVSMGLLSSDAANLLSEKNLRSHLRPRFLHRRRSQRRVRPRSGDGHRAKQPDPLWSDHRR